MEFQRTAQTLLGMDMEDLRALLPSSAPSFRSKQIYSALYRQRVSDWDSITTLPRTLREELTAKIGFGYPELQQRFDSVDGTRRYLLRLIDGKTVEAVLMPEENRKTICISTQVGCPVNCQFCLTALMGLERNLSAGEIVGQVLYILRDNDISLPWDRLNIVMMGMGEPLLNLENVIKATRILTDEEGIGLSEKRITLSTSGIIPKIVEFGKHPVRPKLAISLNASTQDSRNELMPITKKYTLSQLLETCKQFPLRPWEKLTFEYVLLRGVNDSDEDARRVVKLLGNLNCIVNLIALNPGPGIPYEIPSPERVASFQEIVRQHMPCFLRKPRGRDIYAACGQLKRVSEQEINDFPILASS
jgi:23S rRNA (adenine2503-C2)-methyltransferase